MHACVLCAQARVGLKLENCDCLPPTNLHFSKPICRCHQTRNRVATRGSTPDSRSICLSPQHGMPMAHARAAAAKACESRRV